MDKLIDIIIPVFNNDNGLLKTLMSINISSIVNSIIIIDDCSTENNNYNKIIKQFNFYYNIVYKKLEKNSGPGIARQYGLEYVSAKYIMFLDAGDIIVNPIFFNNKISTLLNNNPNIYVFSSAHLQEEPQNFNDTIILENNNRIHGKIYLTSFLKDYNISFCNKSSNINEDIGFNVLCRLICQDLFEKTNIIRILEYDYPFILQTYDINSITRIDNHKFYSYQNYGLGRTITDALQQAENLDISPNLIENYCYNFFCYMYCIHIGAENTRPDCIEKSLNGILYFYQNFLANFINKYGINKDKLLSEFIKTIKSFDDNEPYFLGFPKYNILDFLIWLSNES